MRVRWTFRKQEEGEQTDAWDIKSQACGSNPSHMCVALSLAKLTSDLLPLVQCLPPPPVCELHVYLVLNLQSQPEHARGCPCLIYSS